MKKLLFTALLLAGAASLFAMDEGGDGAYIPSRWELARMGYGGNQGYYTAPEHRDSFTMAFNGWRPIAKPTQAYYGRGYVVYYGFHPIPTRNLAWNPEQYYAFGHPAEFFQKLMPTSIDESNLDRYAVMLGKPHVSYTEYGNMVASDRSITRVTRVVAKQTTEKLAPVGEKPARH